MKWISVLERIPELEKPVLVKIHKELWEVIEEVYAIAFLTDFGFGIYEWKYANCEFTASKEKKGTRIDVVVSSDVVGNHFKIEKNSTFEVVAWKEIENLDDVKLISTRKTIPTDELYSKNGVKISAKQLHLLRNAGCSLIGINEMTYKEIQKVIQEKLNAYKKEKWDRIAERARKRSGGGFDEDALGIYGWDGN